MTSTSDGLNLTWVQAPNPGPKTLDGTLTYVFAAHQSVWVVDPGPQDRHHAQAVVDAVVSTGARRVGGIVLTHHHDDHAGAASMVRRALSMATGVPVPLWCAEPERVPGSTKVPSELSAERNLVASIYHLPGHTSDSLGVRLADGRMLTGDALLGGSSGSIAESGSLHEYMQSLNILRVMAVDGRISGLYPGHGRIIESPLEALSEIESQIAHRQERIEQVRAARARGALTIKRLITELYEPLFAEKRRAGMSPEHLDALREAAEANMRSTLEYLTKGERG